jgi:hypothetical protein
VKVTAKKDFASNTGFNMAGYGTLMEGKLADGKGSWIFSARQSLLEVIDKLVGMSAISLTAIPKYWDTQAKIVYDLVAVDEIIDQRVIRRQQNLYCRRSERKQFSKGRSHRFKRCG